MKLTRFLAVALAAAAVYFRFLRSPILTWGATDSEAGARLAGDELLEDVDGVSTRAVDIDAPASAVWPWIAQMGPALGAGHTHMTGSRTCLASTCTASTKSFPSSSIRRSATRSASDRTECASSESSPSVSSPGARRTATGCGPSFSMNMTARLGLSVATASGFPRSLLDSACSRWRRRLSSWNAKCCTASSSGPSSTPRRPCGEQQECARELRRTRSRMPRRASEKWTTPLPAS